MQSSINSFFKPLSSSPPNPIPCWSSVFDGDDVLDIWENMKHEFVNSYSRRSSKPELAYKRVEANDGSENQKLIIPISAATCSNKLPSTDSTVLNRKRSYAQYHLDVGQSDFVLRTCSSCGVMYAPGDEKDEKGHKNFHSNYMNGIHFKGWLNERVVQTPSGDGKRIIMVLNCDPLAQRNKVQEVIKMMEIELGAGWIFHKLCQAYLFVSSQRIVGCVVAEPIEEAFKVLPYSVNQRSYGSSCNNLRPQSVKLQFGDMMLQREVTKKPKSMKFPQTSDGSMMDGAIICEESPVAALCGIRAIWVTPSNRRKHIAFQMLDAVRKGYCMGYDGKELQLAFSTPTSVGKALASSYAATPSFLVYRPAAADS